MQEGSFRVDVNVSIRPKGDEKLYTRVEVKNINSVSSLLKKLLQVEVIVVRVKLGKMAFTTDEISQETRLYDQEKNETRSMRGKEEAADYRYFPEPDLLKSCS